MELNMFSIYAESHQVTGMANGFVLACGEFLQKVEAASTEEFTSITLRQWVAGQLGVGDVMRVEEHLLLHSLTYEEMDKIRERARNLPWNTRWF
jgi:hypothetical protein